MKNQNYNNITTIIFTCMMVLFVVLSSSIKSYIDDANSNSKEISELLEEETNTKEESKDEDELFSNSSPKPVKLITKSSISSINTTYNCQLNSIRPFFKVHTPPPDFLVFT